MIGGSTRYCFYMNYSHDNKISDLGAGGAVSSIYMLFSQNNTFSGLHMESLSGSVLYISASEQNKFINCNVPYSQQSMVEIVNSSYHKFIGCSFESAGQQQNNIYNTIRLRNGANHNIFENCKILNRVAETAKKPYAAIVEADTCDYNTFINCDFDPSKYATTTMIIVGANTKIKGNRGYITENRGTATVANGATYIDVTHGLSKTPVAQDIIVTPTNNKGSASEYWISDIVASTFRINVDADPGATTATFAWQIN